MTTAAHTPGPWTVQKDGVGRLAIAAAVSPDPGTNARFLWVADVPQTRQANPLWRQEEESEANAALIAAAPDLLASLREGEDIISGLEAAADNAGLDLSEVRAWWQGASALLDRVDGKV